MALSVQIEKELGDFRLDVSFDAGEECLALLGASGCGKSVTLRCIAGILRPDRGRIVLDGRVLFDSEKGIDLKPQERRIGYLFQQYALFPNMTVRQNIEAAVRSGSVRTATAAGTGNTAMETGAAGRREKTRLSRTERSAVADSLLRRFRIEEIADLKPVQISGGQKQRAALARILAADPALICLDEPFSALDSFLRRQLELGLSEMLSGFGGTILWVSHDRGEVYRNCDRVCVMERGKTLETAPVKELFASPKTEAAARLAGCRNFADAAPGEKKGIVKAPAWGLTLHCAGPVPEDFRKAGIWARSLRPADSGGSGTENIIPGAENAVAGAENTVAGAENTFLCRVVREVEEQDCMSILLRPESTAEDAPLLCMELSKEDWEAAKRRSAGMLPHLNIILPPEEILLLR